ncbi:MAG: thioesterase family protein [Rikenellaceae bacterium]
MSLTREFKIRVQYRDTDAMGIVHHSNYVNFCEVARTEILREMGLSYKEMERDGVSLPVREVKMTYLSPAFYDDLITVRLTIEKMPTAKITFFHEIFNEQGTLLNKGEIILVFANDKTLKPCHAPENFVRLLSQNF